MKFSNFLFPDSLSPDQDGRIIAETLREALLTDELGYDVIWLAEHHFDGICAYVDPVSFAAAHRHRHDAGPRSVSRWHRWRYTTQFAWPNKSRSSTTFKRPLIVGLGRGTRPYNIYDYQGFGIDHTEAQARFEEAEEVMFQAWKGDSFEHRGNSLT